MKWNRVHSQRRCAENSTSNMVEELTKCQGVKVPKYSTTRPNGSNKTYLICKISRSSNKYAHGEHVMWYWIHSQRRCAENSPLKNGRRTDEMSRCKGPKKLKNTHECLQNDLDDVLDLTHFLKVRARWTYEVILRLHSEKMSRKFAPQIWSKNWKNAKMWRSQKIVRHAQVALTDLHDLLDLTYIQKVRARWTCEVILFLQAEKMRRKFLQYCRRTDKMSRCEGPKTCRTRAGDSKWFIQCVRSDILPKSTRMVNMWSEIALTVREDAPKIRPQIWSKNWKNVKMWRS